MTNSEAIRQLEKQVSTLEERRDNARTDIKRVDAERSKAAESLIEIDRRLAIIEENVKDLKRVAEEQDRRRWAILLAVVGCFLSVAANVGLIYFRLNK